MDHTFSGDEFLSDGEEFVPEFVSALIPTDAPFSNLKFVAIPVMIKYTDTNIRTKMDIGRIKNRLENQVGTCWNLETILSW